MRVRQSGAFTPAFAHRLGRGDAEDDGTGGVIAKNVTVKAGSSGLHVEGVGNVFQKSAGFDLTDDTSAGDNVFVANAFSKIAP